MNNIKESPQEQARDILSYYFGLQRVVFGCPDAMSHLEYCGWTWADCAELIRIMGDGCHNLSEIAGGHWGPVGDTSTEDDLRTGLEHECRWLYERVETLHIPASWEHSDFYELWKAFWNKVSSVLNVPAKYGKTFERSEPQEQREFRMRMEMECDGWNFSSPFWVRLFSPNGYLVVPPKDRAK